MARIEDRTAAQCLAEVRLAKQQAQQQLAAFKDQRDKDGAEEKLQEKVRRTFPACRKEGVRRRRRRRGRPSAERPSPARVRRR